MASLGWTENPNALVPGASREIYDLIVTMETYSHTLESVGDGLRRIDEGEWQGKAAEQFRDRFEQQPSRWLRASDAFRDGAEALKAYASTLEWAQAQAGEAIALWRAGQEKTEAAAAAGSSALLFNGATPGMELFLGGQHPVVQPNDPGAALKAEAVAKLSEARAQLADAGSEAARRFRAAVTSAPADPTFWENVGSFFAGAGDEVASSIGLLNPANWGTVAAGAAQLARLAGENPDAAFKTIIDYDTMRDDQAKWWGGAAAGLLLGKGAGKLGRLDGPNKLTDHLNEHIFDGHLKADPKGGYRLSGYHHRPGGVDADGLKIVEVSKPADPKGVYHAKFIDNDGKAKLIKESSFFPDSWSRAEVANAVQQAFEGRQPVHGRDGNIISHKWQGVYNGITVEGMFKRESSSSIFTAATLDDVGTAYPKYGR